jgi:hypothetical protein
VFAPFSMKENLNINEDQIIFSIFAESDVDILLKEYANEPKFLDYLDILESSNGHVVNLVSNEMDETAPSLIEIRGELISINFDNIFNGIWRLGGISILIRLIDMSVVTIIRLI